MPSLLSLIPAPIIRIAGRLQFRYPLIGRWINSVAQYLVKDGNIQRGAGKGLYFDARGCNPGYLAGTSQPLEQDLVMRFSRPGNVVYDLGANAGFYAVIAARSVGSQGRVYAFEPTPTLAERVRTNAARNRLANIEVVEAAVSNIDGEIQFGVVGPLSVSNSIRAVGNAGTTVVSCLRLDSFCLDHPHPDLMLIDIEGAELDALEAALEMIRTKHPVIMVEVHWLGRAFIDFCESRLIPLGYSVLTYEGRPLPAGNERYHALLLPEHAAAGWA
jgi:FkbM family methyltransferase